MEVGQHLLMALAFHYFTNSQPPFKTQSHTNNIWRADVSKILLRGIPQIMATAYVCFLLNIVPPLNCESGVLGLHLALACCNCRSGVRHVVNR